MADIDLAPGSLIELAAEPSFRRYHLDELGAGHDSGFEETKLADEGDCPDRAVNLHCDMK
ncbi:hypothetical protein GR238_37990 [Rhizobium leguminosarum]|nr:hypothetical protein [Rhizobium ruizarguesonis]